MDTITSKTAHDILWETNYHLLEEFIAEFHRLPKNNEIYRDVKIGLWCSNQRQRSTKPNYPAYRLELLKKLNFFDGLARIQEDTWEQNYVLLKKFIEKFHRFPQQQEQYKGVNLGNWYYSQKERMKKKNYPDDRFAKMTALGTSHFTVKDRWQYHYELLQKFVEEYHRLPKQLEEFEEVKIGLWCTRQKQQAKQSNYPEEYFQKLLAIGLLDSLKNETEKRNRYNAYNNKLWDEKYQLLVKFIDKYGRVPSGRETYKNVNIGDWYNHQKTLLKHGKCAAERKEKLAAIGLLEADKDNS